jgi:hypothetical protein
VTLQVGRTRDRALRVFLLQTRLRPQAVRAKQSQFDRRNNGGQVLCGTRVITNWTPVRRQKNKANSACAGWAGARGVGLSRETKPIPRGVPNEVGSGSLKRSAPPGQSKDRGWADSYMGSRPLSASNHPQGLPALRSGSPNASVRVWGPPATRRSHWAATPARCKRPSAILACGLPGTIYDGLPRKARAKRIRNQKL